MFKFRFAADFLHSKTTAASLVTTLGVIYSVYSHQVGLFPALAAVAAAWHLTFLRDTLAKLGEFDPEPAAAPAAPEVPAAPKAG